MANPLDQLFSSTLPTLEVDTEASAPPPADPYGRVGSGADITAAEAELARRRADVEHYTGRIETVDSYDRPIAEEYARLARGRAAAAEQRLEALRQRAPVKDPTALGEAGRGFARGTGTGIEMLGGAAEFYGGYAPAPLREMTDYLTSGITEFGRDIRRDTAAPETPGFTSLDPSREGLAGRTGRWAAGAMGEGIASSMPTLAAAIFGGLPLGAAVSTVQGQGQMYNSLREAFKLEGIEADHARLAPYVYTYGTAIGLLDSVTELRALSPIKKAEVVGSMARLIAKRVAEGAAIESATELAQEALEVAGVRHATEGAPRLEAGDTARLIDAAAAGAVPGAGFGAMHGGREALAGRSTAEPAPPANPLDALFPSTPAPEAATAPSGAPATAEPPSGFGAVADTNGEPAWVDVYHGTTAKIGEDGLRPMSAIEPLSLDKGVPAISFATTPDQANAFTRGDAGTPTEDSSVRREQINTAGFATIDWRAFSGSGRWSFANWERLLQELSARGYPGALVRGMEDAGGTAPQYVVLDPSRVRRPRTETPPAATPAYVRRAMELETAIEADTQAINEARARGASRAELEPMRERIRRNVQEMHALEREGRTEGPLYAVTGETAPARDVDPLGYYSAAVEAARAWKQPRGTPQQAIKHLKSMGVKDAEIEATGLEAFLADKKSVTREELSSFLEQNRTRLMEGYYGPDASVADLQQQIKELRARHDAATPRNFLGMRRPSPESLELGYQTESEVYRLQQEIDAKRGKWRQHSLAGPDHDSTNPTYMERVVHLPRYDIDKVNKNNFYSGHFPEPNIVGHYQASVQKDSAGNNVFALSQIQSDWGQAVRDGGARDAAKIAGLKEQIAGMAPQVEVLRAKVKADPAKYNPSDSGVAQWARIKGTIEEEHLISEYNRLGAELRTAESAVPAHALTRSTDQWTNTTLRRALKDAIDSGATNIAIPSGDTVLSYNPGDEHGMQEFYDKIVPKNLGNLLKKMDPSIKGERVPSLKSYDGKKDVGKGFTVFPITDKVRAEVAKGQPMFAVGGSVHDFMPDLWLGKPRMIPRAIRENVLGTMRQNAHMVPDGTDFGTVKHLRPGKAFLNPDKNNAPDRELTATIETVDGSEVQIVFPLSDLPNFRALAMPPGWSNTGAPGVFLFRYGLDTSDNFSRSVRGEVWHEVGHELRRRDKFSPADWSALLAQADALGIRTMPYRDVLQRLGDPDANILGDETTEQIYNRVYAKRPDKAERIAEETVTLMLDMAGQGVLSPQSMAPIQPIVDDIANGVYAGKATGGPAGAVNAQTGPMSAISGEGAGRPGTDVSTDLSPAAIDYMRAGNEGGGGRGGPPRSGDVIPPPPGDRGPPGIPSKPKIDVQPTKSLLDRYHAFGRRLMAWYNPITGIPGFDQYLLGKYRTLGSIDTAEDVSKLIHKGFEKASAEDKKAAYDYLTTRDADPAMIGNEKARETAVYVKTVMDLVGRGLVERGLLSEKSYQKYRGEYLPRLYLKHMIKDKKLNLSLSGGTRPSKMPYLKSRDVDLDSEVRALLGEVKDPAFLASRGIFRPLRDMAILDFLNEISKDGQWVFQESLVPYNGKSVSPYYLRSEAVALRDRAALAESESPENAAKMRTEADNLDRAAAPYIQAEQKVPEGYDRVPDTPRYGMLRGMLVRKEIKNDLLPSMSIIPDDAPYLQQVFKQGGGWQRLNSYFKAMKVPLNPGTQIRNILSNIIMMNMSGVPAHRMPVVIGRAMGELATGGEYYRFAKSHGLKASGFSEQEMGKVAREYLKIERQMALQGKLGFVTYPATIMRQMVDAGIAPFSNLYQMSEAVGKIAKMIDAHEREKMPMGQAYLEAQKWLFDYNTIPNSIRHLRNAPFGMPFVTWSYLALPRIIETAATKPWRMAPYVAIPFILSQMFKLANDVDDDDLDKLWKSIPEWLRKNPSASFLPYKDAKGRWQVYNYGYLLPWGQFLDAASDLKRGDPADALKTVGVLGGPLSQLLVGYKSGIDAFTGRPIFDKTDPPDIKYGKIMQWMARMALPPLLTDQSAVKRMWEAYQNTPSKSGDPPLTMTQAALRLLGQNIYPIEPEVSRQREINRMRKEIRDIDIRRKYETRDQSLDDAGRAARRKSYDDYLKTKRDELRKYTKESAIPDKLRTDLRRKKETNPLDDLFKTPPAKKEEGGITGWFGGGPEPRAAPEDNPFKGVFGR